MAKYVLKKNEKEIVEFLSGDDDAAEKHAAIYLKGLDATPATTTLYRHEIGDQLAKVKTWTNPSRPNTVALGTVTLGFKTPDVVYHAVKDTLAHVLLQRKEDGDEIDDEEAEWFYESQIKQRLEKFVTHGENVKIEINLDLGTATVWQAK